MGKTQTPLNILLTDSALVDHPELKPIIDKMEEQGHDIRIDDSLRQFHFIAGPNCWFMVPEVAALFSQAVDNARKVANANKVPTDKKPAKKAAKPKSPKGSKSKGKGTTTGESTSEGGTATE